ncbi:MAG: helix-turn-helix domain-containing protein [Candidatus Acidiferrales bacterium]
MLIGERIRAVREAKDLSQGHIQHRTGLLRAYVSRVENGHTVPSLETLEKFARALEIPLYQLFYEGDAPPKVKPLPVSQSRERIWGNKGQEARLLARLCHALARMTDRQRQLLLAVAHNMTRRSHP